MSSQLVLSTKVPTALALAAPLMRSHFPVPRKLPVFNFERTRTDAHHVGALTSSVFSFTAR
ncbi:MAG: hypothetical protein A3B67_16835 [Burkholderiales bacterium RIFCSPHIGHO2_02_FULL_66_10]|nr:MAG: hypothetical protein A3B67_16835 [Burkholderiales bacterium RIFCSPHIGHO2_02_FULL_66_10]